MTENNITNILVILAGGIGKRYGADEPKQYSLILGKELIRYSIEEMLGAEEAERIVVVLDKNEEKQNQISQYYNVDVISGGKERANSFQNAIDYVDRVYPTCKKIVFHEAARPLVKKSIIDYYFKLLDEYDFVESCKKVNDSLGSYVIHAPRREDYYLIQAPEAYRFSVLKQYYDCNSDIYFAANQFPAFVKGYQFFDIPHNIKLTTPEDRAVIEFLLKKEQ